MGINSRKEAYFLRDVRNGKVLRTVRKISTKSGHMIECLAPNVKSSCDLTRATDPQILYANWMARILGIEVPAEDSKRVYSKFISEHKEKFKSELDNLNAMREDWPVDHEWGPDPEY